MTDPAAIPAVRALATAPLSADQQTRLHRAVWAERARRLDVPVEVSPCPYDDARLAELHGQGRTVGYLPQELSSHFTRDRFLALFPDLDCYAVPPANGFVNTVDIWGWFDYETAPEAPLRGFVERDALEAVAAEGHTMLTLDQYIVASHDQHLLTGHHLDDRRSWTRLATSYDGRLVAARFDGDLPEEGREDEPPSAGALLVGYDVMPSDKASVLGIRTRSGIPPLRALWDDLWERTTEAYVSAGFPEQLGLDRDAYLAGLPRVPEQPAEYADRFFVPLVVETRIPWTDQARLLGVRLSSHSQRYPFREVDPAARPDVPYVGWFNAWHARFPEPISSIDARALLAEDERGATPIELLAMNAALPDLVRTARFFEAIGYVIVTSETEDVLQRGAERCLSMYRWRGAPEFGANQHPIPYSMFRPLVRGRDVTTAVSGTLATTPETTPETSEAPA